MFRQWQKVSISEAWLSSAVSRRDLLGPLLVMATLECTVYDQLTYHGRGPSRMLLFVIDLVFCALLTTGILCFRQDSLRRDAASVIVFGVVFAFGVIFAVFYKSDEVIAGGEIGVAWEVSMIINTLVCAGVHSFCILLIILEGAVFFVVTGQTTQLQNFLLFGMFSYAFAVCLEYRGGQAVANIKWAEEMLRHSRSIAGNYTVETGGTGVRRQHPNRASSQHKQCDEQVVVRIHDDDFAGSITWDGTSITTPDLTCLAHPPGDGEGGSVSQCSACQRFDDERQRRHDHVLSNRLRRWEHPWRCQHCTQLSSHWGAPVSTASNGDTYRSEELIPENELHNLAPSLNEILTLARTQGNRHARARLFEWQPSLYYDFYLEEESTRTDAQDVERSLEILVNQRHAQTIAESPGEVVILVMLGARILGPRIPKWWHSVIMFAVDAEVASVGQNGAVWRSSAVEAPSFVERRVDPLENMFWSMRSRVMGQSTGIAWRPLAMGDNTNGDALLSGDLVCVSI